MLSQAVLIAAVIDLIAVNINGRVIWSNCLFHTIPSHYAFLLFIFQTEIAKRLNAILAQIMPFLSQEVSVEGGAKTAKSKMKYLCCQMCGILPSLLILQHCENEV